MNPFITGARAIRQTRPAGQSSAAISPSIPSEDTSILVYSAHADYEALPGFFPLVEINGFTAIDNANRSTGALGQLDGVDPLNFGSEDRDTTVTVAGGFRYVVNEHLAVRHSL